MRSDARSASTTRSCGSSRTPRRSPPGAAWWASPPGRRTCPSWRSRGRPTRGTPRWARPPAPSARGTAPSPASSPGCRARSCPGTSAAPLPLSSCAARCARAAPAENLRDAGADAKLCGWPGVIRRRNSRRTSTTTSATSRRVDRVTGTPHEIEIWFAIDTATPHDAVPDGRWWRPLGLGAQPAGRAGRDGPGRRHDLCGTRSRASNPSPPRTSGRARSCTTSSRRGTPGDLKEWRGRCSAVAVDVLDVQS